MPFVSGYPISNAEVLVSYMQSEDKSEEIELQYHMDKGQKIVYIKLKGLDVKSTAPINVKEKYGFSEDAFSVVLVGNRLDTEINGGFMEIMRDIIEISPNVVFFVIGDCSLDFKDYNLEGKVCKLGYVSNLSDYMAGMDLFLNMDRKGGGGGSFYAISNGVPVVTLPDCDVANVVGDSFICNDLKDYPAIVEKYVTDQDWFKLQQNEAFSQA